MIKKTMLYQKHQDLNANIVEYAGYYLPVYYTSIINEHIAVREDCGVFDVSHMGEIYLSGKNVIKFINYLTSNNFDNLQDKRIRYTLLLNTDGGVKDDLLVYKISDEKVLLVVNGANKDKDYKWIKDNLKFGVEIEDKSDEISLLAIQGPKSYEKLSKIFDKLPEKYYSFEFVKYKGEEVLISRTGYTGEDGFEIYFDNKLAFDLYDEILKQDILPCGLGARDTLRIEAAMPLYGHELDEDISPIEAGLSRFIKMDDDFIGKDSLKDNGFVRVGLELIDRGIAREGCKVYFNDEEIGFTTSGTMLPYLKKACAMAMIKKGYSDNLYIDVRNRKLKAKICDLPFYKK